MKTKNSKTESQPRTFLDTSGMARKIAEFQKDEQIYSQGDAAKSVMYIQKGNVKFSVVSSTGKVAVVAMLGPSDFFGEGCMAGQSLRMGTATAITPTTLLAIDKSELLQMLRTQDKLSDCFVEYILSHKNRVEEALIDRLFNSSEKRLARALLVLGRYGKAQHQPDDELPRWVFAGKPLRPRQANSRNRSRARVARSATTETADADPPRPPTSTSASTATVFARDDACAARRRC